ncbi:conserved hypothetical protein [Neospora caninum Liverpool]|uniref:Uncharacterized protein n=1 Tax=Neospora caninum (strain Liverpool) TaxID=572307 RepID=F0VD20_NEOCL|nr:conserved hypothetical protein [Neospora caninum Liverpool]CBZ51535.1 conserved hypothetical protein [Neospora caninum Liverpool]CEL65485.1 TPA: hypothetical protein BN1204_013280 [Neospora caninum Liverpool]|eukprot:XP_003881568.1 conserved hypothetical protein [Neospora caninum Liverpool]
MQRQTEEREGPGAGHDEGWEFARQLAAVSASVESLRRQAEGRLTESEPRQEKGASPVPAQLLERLRALLHDDAPRVETAAQGSKAVHSLPGQARGAGALRPRQQTSQRERDLERFSTSYCALSPLCSEVLTLLQLLLFKETSSSRTSEERKQRGSLGPGDTISGVLDKKAQKDLEDLSELLLSFLCSVFEQESLDVADFCTCHTRRKVSAAVTTPAFLSSLGLFLSSSPSACCSFLPPSPLLRLRCLQLLRAAAAVVPSPAAFSLALALGAHGASSAAETDGGDRLLFAGLAAALEGPQAKLLQTKKQPSNSRGGVWLPPLACNAAPEESLSHLSQQKASMRQDGSGGQPRESACLSAKSSPRGKPAPSADAWSVAWGRTFTACSCLSRGCGPRSVSFLSRVLAGEAGGDCLQLADAVAGPGETQALSPNQVAAAVGRWASASNGSAAGDTSGARCGAVPIRYALRQEALCLLLQLLLHKDKSVGLTLLQRPPNRQPLAPPLSSSPSTASPAGSRPSTVADLFVRAFLPLRFDRRQDALVWLLGFRRALRDLEIRARMSAAFRAAAGGRRGGREGSAFSEIFSKGAKSGPGEEDSSRGGEETGREGPSLPSGGANPVGWIWRRVGTGPVLQALAHLLHSFTSRESLGQLLGPLTSQMETTQEDGEDTADNPPSGSEVAIDAEAIQRASRGTGVERRPGRSLGAGCDAAVELEKPRMFQGTHNLYLALLPSSFLSSFPGASCSSPSWLLQSLLGDFLLCAVPPSSLDSGSSVSATAASRPSQGSSSSSPQSALVLSFLQALRPVFLPPQQELLLSLLAAYPLELHTRFLETFSALHLAARSSVQFALSHFLLFRLLLLPLDRLRDSAASLTGVLPAVYLAPSFVSPSGGFNGSTAFSAAASGASTAPTVETLQAATQVQLQEVAIGERRRHLIQPLVSLMSPPCLQLRQHLTASLLHSSLSVNFFGFVLLRVACRLFQAVAETLAEETAVAEGTWGRDSLSRLLKAAMRERLPDEKTVLNCLKKLEQHFRVFPDPTCGKQRKSGKARLVWDVEGWDADELWPTDEALVREQMDRDLTGGRKRKGNGGDAPRSAKKPDEDEELDLHLDGLEDLSDEDTADEFDADETPDEGDASRNGNGEAGGSRSGVAAASPSLTPAFILNLSLRLLHSRPSRRRLPQTGGASADAVAHLCSPASSRSARAMHPSWGTMQAETTLQLRRNDEESTPLGLLLSCLDVAHLYQALLLPPGGFSFDWSRLLTTPTKLVPAPQERTKGDGLVSAASEAAVLSPSVWALEPEAGAAIVALGLQALGGGGDGLDGHRFGFQVGSIVSKPTLIFLTQLLFQWRLSVQQEEVERPVLGGQAALRVVATSLRDTSFSEHLLGLFSRCLSVSPLFQTAPVNELAIWLAALSPRQPQGGASSGAQAPSFCFRCAASYFLAIVKFAVEKPLLLLHRRSSSSLDSVDASSPYGSTCDSPSSRQSEPAGAAGCDSPGVSLFVRALLAHLSLAPECTGGKPLYVDVVGPSLSLFLSSDAPPSSLAHAESCPASAAPFAPTKRDTALCVDSIGAWVSRGLLALLALRPCLLEPVRGLLDRQRPWRVVGAALGAGREASGDGGEGGEKGASEEAGHQKKTKDKKKDKNADKREEDRKRKHGWSLDGEEVQAKGSDGQGEEDTVEREHGGETEEDEKQKAIAALRQAAARHPLYPRINAWRRRLSAVLKEAIQLAAQERETRQGKDARYRQTDGAFQAGETSDGDWDGELEEAPRLLPSEHLLSQVAYIEETLPAGASDADGLAQKTSKHTSAKRPSCPSADLPLELLLRHMQPSRALVSLFLCEAQRMKNAHFLLPLQSSFCSSCAPSWRCPLPVSRSAGLSPSIDAARSNVGALLGFLASCLRQQTTRLSLCPTKQGQDCAAGERVISLLQKLLNTFHLVQHLNAGEAGNRTFFAWPSEETQQLSSVSGVSLQAPDFGPVSAPFPSGSSCWSSSVSPSLAPAEVCDESVFVRLLMRPRDEAGLVGPSLEQRVERELSELAFTARARANGGKKAKSGKGESALGEGRKKRKREGDASGGEEKGESTFLQIAVLSCTYITTVLIQTADRVHESYPPPRGLSPRFQQNGAGFLTLTRRLLPLLLTRVAIPLSRLAALEQRRRLGSGSQLAAASGHERRQGDSGSSDPRGSLSSLPAYARETLQRICAAAAAWGLEKETLLTPAVAFLHGVHIGLVREVTKGGQAGDCQADEPPQSCGDASDRDRKKNSEEREKRGGSGGREGEVACAGTSVSDPGSRFPPSLEGRWPLDLMETYVEHRLQQRSFMSSRQPLRAMPEAETAVVDSPLRSSFPRALDTDEIRLLLALLQLVDASGSSSEGGETVGGLSPAFSGVYGDAREEQRHRRRVAKLLVSLLDALDTATAPGARAGPLYEGETSKRGEGKATTGEDSGESGGSKTPLGTFSESLRVAYERHLVRQCLVPATWILPASASPSATPSTPCDRRVGTPEAADSLYAIHPGLGRLFHDRFAGNPFFRAAVQLELGTQPSQPNSCVSGCSQFSTSSLATPLTSPSLVLRAESVVLRRQEGEARPSVLLLSSWRFALELLQLREGALCLLPLFPSRLRLAKRLLALAGDIGGDDSGPKASGETEDREARHVDAKKEKKKKKIKEAATKWGEGMLRILLRVHEASQEGTASDLHSVRIKGDADGSDEERFSPVAEQTLMQAALDFYEGRDAIFESDCWSDSKGAEEARRFGCPAAVSSPPRRCSGETETDANDKEEEDKEVEEGKKVRTREAKTAGREDIPGAFALVRRGVTAIQDSLISLSNPTNLPLQGQLFFDAKDEQGAITGAVVDGGKDGNVAAAEARLMAQASLQRVACLWMAVGLYEACRRLTYLGGDENGKEAKDDGDESDTTEKRARDRERTGSAFLGRFLVDAFASLCCRLSVEVFCSNKADALARALLPPARSLCVSAPSLPLSPSSLSASSLASAARHLLARLESLLELLIHDMPVRGNSADEVETASDASPGETEVGASLLDFFSRLQLTVSLWGLLRRLPLSWRAEKKTDPDSLPSSPLSSASLRHKADRCMLRLARSFCRRQGGAKKLDEFATILASRGGPSVSADGEKAAVDPKKVLASARRRACLFAGAWCQVYLPVWRAGLLAASALPASPASSKASGGRKGEKKAEDAEGADEATLRRKRVWTLAEEIVHSDALWQLATALRFLCYAAAKDAQAGSSGDTEGDGREAEGQSGRPAMVRTGAEKRAALENMETTGSETVFEPSDEDLQLALLPLFHCLGSELLPIYYSASAEKRVEDTDAGRGEGRRGNSASWDAGQALDGYEGGEGNWDTSYGDSQQGGRSIFFADEEEEEAREAEQHRSVPQRGEASPDKRPLALLIDLLPKELYALFASLYGASTSSADLCLRNIFMADRAEVREVYIHSSFAFTAQRAAEAGTADSHASPFAVLPVTDALAWTARLPQPQEGGGERLQATRRAEENEGEDALLLLLRFLRQSADATAVEEAERGRRKRRKDRQGTKQTRDCLAHAWTLDDFHAFVNECDEDTPSLSLTSVLVTALGSSQATALDWLGLNPVRVQKTLDAFPFAACLPRNLETFFDRSDRGDDAPCRPGDGHASLAGRCTVSATPLVSSGASVGCLYTSAGSRSESARQASEASGGEDALFRLLSPTNKTAGIEVDHEMLYQARLALSAWVSDRARSFASPSASCDEAHRRRDSAKGEVAREAPGDAAPAYDAAYLVPFLTGRLVAACASLLYQLGDPREAEGRKSANEEGPLEEEAEVEAGDRDSKQERREGKSRESVDIQVQPRRDASPSLAVLARRACGTAHRWLQLQRDKAEPEETGGAARERRRRRKRRRHADGEDEDTGDLGYAEDDEEAGRENAGTSATEDDTDSRLLVAFDVEELERATNHVWPFLNAARQLQTRQRMRREQTERLKQGGEAVGDFEAETEDDGRRVEIEELANEEQAEEDLERWAEEKQKVDQQGVWLRRFASGGGLQILLMALSSTDSEVRRVAYHGLAVFSHLLNLSGDLTLLLAFAEKRLLLSKIAALSASLSAAVGDGSASAASQKTSLLSARKRMLTRQLEQHRSGFAFRELRQVQLLLAAVRSSIAPPAAPEPSADTGAAAAEGGGEDAHEGRTRDRKRRRRRSELEDEEDCDGDEAWREMETGHATEAPAERNDADLCPEALHPILTAFAASAVPFLLQPEHPLFSLLNEFLLQRSNLSSLLFSRAASPFLYLPARASASAGPCHATGLGSLFSTFLLSPVSVSSLQQKQFVLTCLLRALAASTCAAPAPSVSDASSRARPYRDRDAETVSLLLPPSSVFLFASSPTLAFASFSSPFLAGVFAALQLSLQLPAGFANRLVLPAATLASGSSSRTSSVRALPIACWNACALLQRQALVPWLLHHTRLLLFPPASPFSSPSSPLAAASSWGRYLSFFLWQTLPLPHLSSALSSVRRLRAEAEARDKDLRSFAQQRRDALHAARDVLALFSALLDASLLAPVLPSFGQDDALGLAPAGCVDREAAKETADEELRRGEATDNSEDLEIPAATLEGAWRRAVLLRLLHLFVSREEEKVADEETHKQFEPTPSKKRKVKDETHGTAKLRETESHRSGSQGTAPRSSNSDASQCVLASPEGDADLLLRAEVVAWPLFLGFSLPPVSPALRPRSDRSLGDISSLAAQVAVLRSRLLGIPHPSPAAQFSASVSTALNRNPRRGREGQAPPRVQASSEGPTLLVSLFEFLRFIVRLWYALNLSRDCRSSLPPSASSTVRRPGAGAGSLDAEATKQSGFLRFGASPPLAEKREDGERDEVRQAASRLFQLCWRLCWCACSLFQPAFCLLASPAIGCRDAAKSPAGEGAVSPCSRQVKKLKKHTQEEESETTEWGEDEKESGASRRGENTTGRFNRLALSPLQKAQLQQLRQAAAACVADVLTLCEAVALSTSRDRRRDEVETSRGSGGWEAARHGEARWSDRTVRTAAPPNFERNNAYSTEERRVCEVVLAMLSQEDGAKAMSPLSAERRQALARKEELLLQWLQIWCLLSRAPDGDTCAAGLLCEGQPARFSLTSSRSARYIKWMCSQGWRG